MECRICGAPVELRRVELGYDYCTADECQRRCVEQPKLVAVGVNKAADQFVRAEAVLPQGEMAGNRLDEAPIARASREGPTLRRRRVGTLAKLRMAEAELDRRLEESFQRFRRSEITAEEMARECDDLIRAYNSRVMAENIRYRSMLRQRRSA